MFTAINALSVHQMFMDTLSDNLANVNTPGFKSSYISFKDQFAQTMRVGSAPSTQLGGVNPIQIGLGTNLGTISPNFTQGALQSTGRQLDLAIQGDGFFVYSPDSLQRFYSRDGSLVMDSLGYLTNSSTGERVLGWQADPATGTVNTGGGLTGIQIPIDASTAKQTENVHLMGNLDSAETTYNVTFGAYDKMGNLRSVTLKFDRGATIPNPSGTGTLTTWTYSVVNPTGTPAAEMITGSGSVTFNESGQYVNSAATNTITVPPLTGSGTDAFTANIDMKGMTMLDTYSSVAAGSQDGLAAGTLNGFNISSKTGEIYGTYSNGEQQLIGQLALATFVNTSGLVRAGDSRWQAGLNSGEARIGSPSSGDRGTIASGYVEGSNTDMSREFSNMILAQRGFQASSRVITASDEMLQELVNLKR
jgi:flagellar hook protein FlgE